MRRSVLSVLILLCIACGSSGIPEGFEEPVVSVYPAEGQFMPSAVNPRVQATFLVSIYNPNDLPLTLEKLRFRSTGTTSLRIRSRTWQRAREIGPKGSIEIEMRVDASVSGPDPETEPIRVRGTAIFSAGDERFRVVFTSTARQ